MSDDEEVLVELPAKTSAADPNSTDEEVMVDMPSVQSLLSVSDLLDQRKSVLAEKAIVTKKADALKECCAEKVKEWKTDAVVALQELLILDDSLESPDKTLLSSICRQLETSLALSFPKGQETAANSPVLTLSGCDGLVGAILTSSFVYDKIFDYIFFPSWQYVTLKTPGLYSNKMYSVHMAFTHIQGLPQITVTAWQNGTSYIATTFEAVKDKVSFACLGTENIRMSCAYGSCRLTKVEFHEQN